MSRPIAAAADADPRRSIRDLALAQGFDAVGFARAESSAAAKQGLADYLTQGFHGDMGWLAANADRRADPRAMWPEARTAVVVGLNYGPDRDPLEGLADKAGGNVSVYARGRDYHDLIKKRLKALAREIVARHGGAVKVFVDTAPLMEKPLAMRAGVGWQGKHTNLVSRELGSWFFLGSVLTTLEIAPDAPETDHCGQCRRCHDACPTNAFPAPYRLDARRCISYLTIEHKGHIPREFRVPMGNRIYGCDDCLAVCPWNKFASATDEASFAARPGLEAPRLADLARLDDASFRVLFADSPIKRIGRDRFVRNVIIALGNSGDPTAVGIVEGLLGDSSPLVRAMAVWALGRLAPHALPAARAKHGAAEVDADVRAEWNS
ncbi:MAG: tRNA epoxyqueuosine(34) reductase QueG [Alphaproteobacteria bacterium]|nr:tRNA epoxyqueuosine(34) reductase QueG [Alphaproteobacteria bacterium]